MAWRFTFSTLNALAAVAVWSLLEIMVQVGCGIWTACVHAWAWVAAFVGHKPAPIVSILELLPYGGHPAAHVSIGFQSKRRQRPDLGSISSNELIWGD